jgi:hypothetical protein
MPSYFRTFDFDAFDFNAFDFNAFDFNAFDLGGGMEGAMGSGIVWYGGTFHCYSILSIYADARLGKLWKGRELPNFKVSV